jgi:hypothetical protein
MGRCVYGGYRSEVMICPTFGWSRLVTVIGGKTVYLSGRVSVNERGEVNDKG